MGPPGNSVASPVQANDNVNDSSPKVNNSSSSHSKGVPLVKKGNYGFSQGINSQVLNRVQFQGSLKVPDIPISPSMNVEVEKVDSQPSFSQQVSNGSLSIDDINSGGIQVVHDHIHPHSPKPPDIGIDSQGVVQDLSLGGLPLGNGPSISSQFPSEIDSSLQDVIMDIVNETPGMNSHEGDAFMSIDSVIHD